MVRFISWQNAALHVVLFIAPCHATLSPRMRTTHAQMFMREANARLQPRYRVHNFELLNDQLRVVSGKTEIQQMMEIIAREDMRNTTDMMPLHLQREPLKVVTEQNEGFVRIRTIKSQSSTKLVVEVATPETILYVFLIMYTPVLLAWAQYFRNGRPEETYILLLPITLCATLIGDNFVQKSLAMLMESPMAITSAQAAAMGVISAVWVAVERKPLDLKEAWWPLVMWGMVAVMFTTYQMLNHLVAFYCSLAERTVFTNLCPVVSLTFEATVMPKNLRASVSFQSKLALALLVLGAITFSIQYPDFTVMGIIWASLMVAAVVPYRLAQRYTLSECKFLPVMLLVMYDGFFLMTPSTAIAAAETNNYIQEWNGWIADPSVQLLLFLSVLTFTANHACALLVLQMNSATALQVYQNLSNFIVVALGILFFGDNVLSSPVTFLGLVMCLVGGLWYAIEVQPKSAPKESVEASKDEPIKCIKA